jgi:hypothetical protein
MNKPWWFEMIMLWRLFTMGGIKAKGCYFQLGPILGVDNLPIEQGFISQNSFLTQEGEMVDGYCK